MKKRILSLALAAALVCGLFSTGALAAGSLETLTVEDLGMTVTNVVVGMPVPGEYESAKVVSGAAGGQTEPSTVSPSPCAATLDGKPITFNAYLFAEGSGGINYIMLRDVAMLLSNTKAQFDVAWTTPKGLLLPPGKPIPPWVMN